MIPLENVPNRVRVSLLGGVYAWSDETLVFSAPPFRITEEGWGEFDMTIVLSGVEKGGDHSIVHDLNFQSGRYEAKHVIVS